VSPKEHAIIPTPEPVPPPTRSPFAGLFGPKPGEEK
jgi:hypothetical protein